MYKSLNKHDFRRKIIYTKNYVNFFNIYFATNRRNFLYNTLKLNNVSKIPLKYTVNTLNNSTITLLFISWNFYTHQKTQECNKNKNWPQNTVCLEQQIYTSPKKFTQALLVMLETFRRSGLRSSVSPGLWASGLVHTVSRRKLSWRLEQATGETAFTSTKTEIWHMGWK